MASVTSLVQGKPEFPTCGQNRPAIEVHKRIHQSGSSEVAGYASPPIDEVGQWLRTSNQLWQLSATPKQCHLRSQAPAPGFEPPHHSCEDLVLVDVGSGPSLLEFVE